MSNVQKYSKENGSLDIDMTLVGLHGIIKKKAMKGGK